MFPAFRKCSHNVQIASILLFKKQNKTLSGPWVLQFISAHALQLLPTSLGMPVQLILSQATHTTILSNH